MINRFFRKYTLSKVCLVYLLFVFVLLFSNVIKNPVYPELENKTLTCIGTVYTIEEKNNSFGDSSIYIGLKALHLSKNYPSMKGLLVVLKEQDTLPKLGERIEVRGTVQNFNIPRNPGEFDSLRYYRSLGYSVRLKSASILRHNCSEIPLLSFLFKLRCYMADTMDQVCGFDSGIMKSIVLGDKSDLDTEQKQLFLDGGIGHIIAISGLHISFFGIGLYKLLKQFSIPLPFSILSINRLYLPKFLCVFISIVIMGMYCILTGGSPSAIRATIMFAMSLLADLIGRTYDRITALSLAACTICVIEPRLLFQSSFLMSFGAIIGITFIHPILTNLWDNSIFNLFAISSSVTLATLPVQLSSYYQFPIYSFFLNLIVVPLMGLVMLSGMGAIVLGKLNIAFGSIVFFPGHLCIKLFQILCEFQNRLPGHCIITGKPEHWQILLYYVVIGFLLILVKYEYHSSITLCGIQGLITRPVVLSAIVAAIIIISRPWVFHPYMYVMDVGQGDWIIFRDRFNHTITIDGGSSSESKLYDYTILPVLKSLGIKKIDYMILSHTDSDHVSGSLKLLENLPMLPLSVDRVILPPKWAAYDSENYGLLFDAAISNCVPVTNLSKGTCFNTGDLSVKVLWPDKNNRIGDVNGDCLVTRADIYESTNKHFSALLTGDLDGAAEEKFIRKAQVDFPELVDVDVLKVGHHGSKVSSSRDFLAATSPKIAVISVGKNSYGHPNSTTVDRLRNYSSKALYSTKDIGAVKIDLYSCHTIKPKSNR